MCIHRTNDGCDRRFLVVAGWWVSDISPEEYNRLIEYLNRQSDKLLIAYLLLTTAVTGENITLGRIVGTRMLLTPPSLTLIFRHRLDSVCGEVLFTFLAWTHWVAIPKTVSPTRFTSAVIEMNKKDKYPSLVLSLDHVMTLKTNSNSYHKQESFRGERHTPTEVLGKSI